MDQDFSTPQSHTTTVAAPESTPVVRPLSKPVAALLARPVLLVCGVLMLLGSTFLVGMGTGYGVGRWTQRSALFGAPVAAAAVECSDELSETQSAFLPHMALFWEAMNLLYRDFYGDLPDAESAVYAAIRGIVSTLDDPNTSFLTPVEAGFFRSNMEGSFEGIGARVGWNVDEDTVMITEPFEDQPAWLAGLRRDDLILAVDGESLVGTDLAVAVQKIRGPKGSTVVLTIKRVGENISPGEATFDIAVVRDRIEIPTIRTDAYGENGEVAYIQLNSFNENAGQLVREAVAHAVQNNAKALVFDLRGNAGGLLREAVRVTSVFLEDDTVLLERFSDGRLETYTTAGRSAIGNLPVVVLVNAGSASASEIVAGALQDAERATLIGTTTYGKGSVQLPHTLSNGGIMRVTIARWYTPLDRTIDGIGLEPDIVIDRTPEDVEADVDPQLDAAIQFLISAVEVRSR
jgi:carboxyl-terminal processing protease